MRIPGRRLAPIAAVLALAGGVLAGCDWPLSPIHKVTITDTTSGVSGIPSSIPTGQYVFTVSESVPNGGVQLARFAPGYTPAQAMADAAKVFGPPSSGFSAAAHRFYSNVFFEGGIGGSGAFSVHLSPGSYVALDSNTNKYEPFTVTFAKALPNPPKSNLKIAGVMGTKNGADHFEWHVRGDYAKSGVLNFINANGDEPHFLEMVYLKPGKTFKECSSYSGDPSSSSAPCVPVLETQLVSPGGSMTMPYNFTNAGKYILLCFVPDADTGVPHAMLGMIATITLH